MAKFIRHIGKHNDKQVAIIRRKIPGEEHLCMVIYPQYLQRHLQDQISKVVESDVGQSSDSLDDALFRTLEANSGTPILVLLHKECFIKKVKASEVLVTPVQGAHMRLDELNRMLDDIERGGEAAKKMQAASEQLGLQHPADVRKRMQEIADPVQLPLDVTPALSDADLARMTLEQADRMEAEANMLLTEAKRMREQFEPAQDSVVEVPKKTTRRKSNAVAG